MKKLTGCLIAVTFIVGCADLPVSELQYLPDRMMGKKEDGRTDIVDCVNQKGDIVFDETTNQALCQLPSKQKIELRDLK